MTVAKIVQGQDYILCIEGNKKALERVKLGRQYQNLLKYQGECVTVSSVTNAAAGIFQRVYIKNSQSRFGNGYYYPPEVFQLVKQEFVVGGEYVCDHVPDDAHDDNDGLPGWSEMMDDWCGKTLFCKSICSNGKEAEFELPGSSETFFYAKHWVRPAAWAKPIKIVSNRNVFNFWPGAE